MTLWNKAFIMGIFLALILTGCQPSAEKIAAAEQALYQTEQAALVDALMETAIFETQVVLQLTEMAPTSTFTPAPTLTPTPAPTSSATPEVVEKNPWVLQEECDPFDTTLCIKYSINNKNSWEMGKEHQGKWLHVSLTKIDTNEKGYFVVPPDTFASITLIPGEYRALYYVDCDREDYFARTWAITERTDYFYCKNGNDLTYGGVK